MPRGRHRHSPPLHRLLPPSAIAGVSLVCAFGPWVFTDPGVLRVVAATAAATAVVGAAVMRRWDAHAGKQVADLARGRASDEWRHEERVAELETDLEESRELRAKLDRRLRAKRAELAGLRNEHAALLRRYATAETERASALEGRRLLEIEAAEPSRALPPAPLPEAAAEEAEEEKPGRPTAPGVFSPDGSRLFLRAQAALARLDDDREPPAVPAPRSEAERETGREHGTEDDEEQGQPGAADGHEPAAADTTAEPDRTAAPEQPSGGHFTVPTAVAVLPAVSMPRPLVTGGFDFFGMQKDESSTALDAVQNEDLADVVGPEALALHKAETEASFKPAGPQQSPPVSQVIDLTAHDETEQIDMQGLRSAVS
ncbi:hypothetical protein [Streptomyces sp. NPDC086787]|uniref:hypothetical protein n=1 Tax=Streptomyces sp. NPDC086787 TaxID=3365759 RepID=UPI00382A54C4